MHIDFTGKVAAVTNAYMLVDNGLTSQLGV